MTSDGRPEQKFWQIGLADLELQLGASRNGLSSAEIAARRLRYGPNILEERLRLSLPRKFLSRFRNPLVLILLVAAAISGGAPGRVLEELLDEAGVKRRKRA